MGNPANWYDATRPESAEFYGLIVQDFHLSIPLAAGRSVAGRSCATPVPRVWTVEATLVASTCRGTEYGKEWLTRALNNVCIEDGCCPEREAIIQRWCTDDDAGSRSAIDVRMVEIEFAEGDDGIPCCQGCPVTFTLESDPWLYGEPDGCVVEGPWSFDDPICITWCDDCPTPIEPDIDPSDPCGPQPPIAPPPVALSVCWCEPIQSVRQCCHVTAMPEWSDSVIRLTIFAGSEPFKNARVRIWPEHPTMLDPETPAGQTAFHCFPTCAEAEISQIPAFSTLVIDGVTRTIYLTLAGGQTFRADNLVFGPSRTLWDHPALVCGLGNWVCLDADAANTAVDATLTVELIPREIG
jgi:hypothetical protein